MYKNVEGSLGGFVIWSCENQPGTMHERLTDNSGNVIVKNILKFESIESDFCKLSQKLSLNIDKLPHKNSSKNSREKSVFINSVIGMVKRTYEKNFTLFGYPLDPPENWLPETAIDKYANLGLPTPPSNLVPRLTRYL